MPTKETDTWAYVAVLKLVQSAYLALAERFRFEALKLDAELSNRERRKAAQKPREPDP